MTKRKISKKRKNPEKFDRHFVEDEIKIKLSFIKHNLDNYSDRQLVSIMNKLSEIELGV